MTSVWGLTLIFLIFLLLFWLFGLYIQVRQIEGKKKAEFPAAQVPGKGENDRKAPDSGRLED